MLLPKLLKEKLKQQGKSCTVGFSLHTPFPAKDFWRALPVRKELTEGILASDQVGFHTDEYKVNFIQSCSSLLYVAFPLSRSFISALLFCSDFTIGAHAWNHQIKSFTKVDSL